MTKKAAEDDGGSNLMDQGSVQPAFSFGGLLIGSVHIGGGLFPTAFSTSKDPWKFLARPAGVR